MSRAFRRPHHEAASAGNQGDTQKQGSCSGQGNPGLERLSQDRAEDNGECDGESAIHDPSQNDEGYPESGGWELAQQARPD